MNNKVAIMTWHSYNNYGTVLQAYASRKYIEILGYDVDLIDYLPKEKEVEVKDLLNYKNIRNKFVNKDEKVALYNKKLVEKFKTFRDERYSYTERCETQADLYRLNSKYDKFVCGSDQIWSPNLFDENYFLKFVDNPDKKIAYAPSFGVNEIVDDELKVNIGDLVKDIGSLSIREDVGVNIIKDIANRDAKVVLDPTLLLEKEIWKENFNLKKTNEEYIFVYCLGKIEEAYKIAKAISQEHNLKIKIIGNNPVYCKKYKEYVCASPEEFLNLIYGAKLVITDSFHGTIFSMNFNIPFITLKRFKDGKKSQNSRIYSILKITKCLDRLYDDNLEYFQDNFDLDFKTVNNELKLKREESQNYLKNSLQKECRTKSVVKNITHICTGCGVCVAACPQKCISIKLNNNGFWKSCVDEEKCIKCGICRSVCSQNKKDEKEISLSKLYSAYSTDKDVLLLSSSGGIAYELARHAIENDIPVAGCSYNYTKNIAEHIVIKDVNEMASITGSKYVQSYTAKAIEEIMAYEKAVVIGTPCQISSLDLLLKSKKKRDNFILVDLICHGVPSYLLWNKFIKEFANSNVEYVSFRTKRFGWHKKVMQLNKKIYKNENKNIFYDFFNLSSVYNESCYECTHRHTSAADIRIGDFWGSRYSKRESGVSMVIVNTEAGNTYLNEIQKAGKIVLQSEDINNYFTSQQIYNIKKPKNYDEVIEQLKVDGVSLRRIFRLYCLSKKREKDAVRFVYAVYKKILKGGKI